MDPIQVKIIELLREVHLLALKEIERLNLRIAELEIENCRQPSAPEIAKVVEKRFTATNPAPMTDLPHPKPTEMLTE